VLRRCFGVLVALLMGSGNTSGADGAFDPVTSAGATLGVVFPGDYHSIVDIA